LLQCIEGIEMTEEKEQRSPWGTLVPIYGQKPRALVTATPFVAPIAPSPDFVETSDAEEIKPESAQKPTPEAKFTPAVGDVEHRVAVIEREIARYRSDSRRGLPGPAGAASTIPGPQGPKGDKGDSVVGPKGDKGEPGISNVPGPVGPRGPIGPQGERGPQGQPGVSDVPGPQGKTGAIGPAGPQGLKGDRGEAGRDGVSNVPGPQGPQGEKGDTGEKGEQGAKGDPGPRGPAGPIEAAVNQALAALNKRLEEFRTEIMAEMSARTS
jgi:hypothetical protein